MVAGITVRRFRNRVRIVVPNCTNIDLVMWVSCLNTTFWSRASTDENEIILHTALFGILIVVIWLRIVVMNYHNIITHIIYTMTSCLPLHSALELEATQGHSIEYYRPSACNIRTLNTQKYMHNDNNKWIN